MKKEITMYSTPTCHFCHIAEAYFTEHNLEFTKHDVASDVEKRTEMMELTGQMGVPVIKIGDDIVIGFNEAKIKELLESDDSAETETDTDAEMGMAA